MKNTIRTTTTGLIIFFAAIAATGTVARADSTAHTVAGPTIPTSRFLVSYLSMGGLAMIPAHGVALLDDGQVVEVIQGNKMGAKLGKIADTIRDNIKEAYADLRKGELKDSDPERPICMDAPTSTLSVRNAYGQLIAFRRFSDCHQYNHEAADSGAFDFESAARLLHGFSALQGFAHRE